MIWSLKYACWRTSKERQKAETDSILHISSNSHLSHKDKKKKYLDLIDNWEPEGG